MRLLALILLYFLLLLNNGLCVPSSPVSRSKQSTLWKDVRYHHQSKNIPSTTKEHKVEIFYIEGKNKKIQAGNFKRSHDQPVTGYKSAFPLVLSKTAEDVKALRKKKPSRRVRDTSKITEKRYKLQQKTRLAIRKHKSINVSQRILQAKLLSRTPGLICDRHLRKRRKRSTKAIKMLKGLQQLDRKSDDGIKVKALYINIGGEGPKKFRKRSTSVEVPVPLASQGTISKDQSTVKQLRSTIGFLKNKELNKTVVLASNSQANKCVLAPSSKSLSKFRHVVFYEKLNYVQFLLIPGKDVSFSANDYVVENLKWVWTFNGKDGAREFLRWPVEYGIWSLGLLTVFTDNNMEIELIRRQGNCSNLTVGYRPDDLVISTALNHLSQSLANFSTEFESRYGPSFFCYKRRIFVNPKFLYVLCKNIMCPLDLLKYNCCANAFHVKELKRYVDCDDSFRYDTLWWTVPSVVAVLVFASCPLFIMYISSKCSEMFVCEATNPGTSRFVNDREPEIIFLDEKYPYTLLGTLLCPLGTLIKHIPHWTRIVRFFIPFCSLFFILLQILLDYLYLYDFVITSIDKGVVLGFRSLIAGFRKSSENFMPFFGGPYVSLAIYLCLTCLSITVPKCLSSFLESGLQKYHFKDDTWTPLILDLQSIEYFGSVSISKTHGFKKIYTVYLCKFYMLLNFKFWKYVLSIYTKRWQSFRVCQICWLISPVYCIICILEIAICIVLNLLPIVSFGFTVGLAFCSALSNFLSCRRPRTIMLLAQQILYVMIVISVLFVLFVFCTICLDACLFVTRICMFTYTGIIVYPKESYGFLIFAFTVVYYLIVCSHAFAMKYRKLLKTSISACRRVQRSDDQPRLLVDDGENPGIYKPLFQHIVELHCPKRKQAFISFYKLLMIVAILGLSLNLMRKTDRFRQLDTLVHVGTALFTCALPTICMNACRAPDEKYKERALKKEIMKTIVNYAGYCRGNSDNNELLSD